MEENLYTSRDKEKGNFVKLKDSTVIVGDEVKMRYPFLGQSFVEVNKDRVKLKEVDVLQNSTAYYKNVNGTMMPRIAKGGINVYLTYRKYSNSNSTTSYNAVTNTNVTTTTTYTTTYPVYFIQKTDSGKVKPFEPKYLDAMVGDYQPAKEYMDIFYQKRKVTRMWTWINAGVITGGVAYFFISKGNANSTAKFSTGEYVASGAVLGGLVSGLINMMRRGNNYKNLFEAISEYNYGYNRRKK